MISDDNITEEVVTRISREMRRNVVSGFRRRVDERLLRDGRHLAEIVYKN